MYVEVYMCVLFEREGQRETIDRSAKGCCVPFDPVLSSFATASICYPLAICIARSQNHVRSTVDPFLLCIYIYTHMCSYTLYNFGFSIGSKRSNALLTHIGPCRRFCASFDLYSPPGAP